MLPVFLQSFHNCINLLFSFLSLVLTTIPFAQIRNNNKYQRNKNLLDILLTYFVLYFPSLSALDIFPNLFLTVQYRYSLLNFFKNLQCLQYFVKTVVCCFFSFFPFFIFAIINRHIHQYTLLFYRYY